MPPAPAAAKARIRELALALGFDAVGFARAELAPEAKRNLAAYLARGYHGDMGWLAGRTEARGAPSGLWPAAESVVALGLSYATAADPLAPLERREHGTISCYAQGRDYHLVIKKKLKALARWMAEELDCQVKLFVDTAPVMEKPLAEAAGLGTCPISQIRNKIDRACEILELPDGVFPIAGLAVGWPQFPTPRLSLRLPPSVVVHTDRYDENALDADVEAYDRRRHEHRPIPPEKQRLVDKYGAVDYCPWSENATRQLSEPERAGFRAFLETHGFALK